MGNKNGSGVSRVLVVFDFLFDVIFHHFVIILSFSLLLLNIYAINAYADNPNYSLSISSSGAQSINVAPKYGATGTSISADSITVSTNCRSGYNFTISTSVNNNNLYLNGDAGNNVTGTYFTPSNNTTTLKNSPNTWGYYYNPSSPGVAPTANSIFNTIPTNSTPTTIISELSNPSNTSISDSFNIYYGVAVSNTLPGGTYTMIPDANNSNSPGAIVYHVTMAEACIPYIIQFNSTSTIDGNTVSGTGIMNNQEYYRDDSVTIPTSTFTPPLGYEFDGWNTAQNGTGTSYDENQVIANLTTPGSIVTLYAQWKQITLYSTIAEMSKGKQTASNLQTEITVPTSADYTQDTSNSGVFEYDSSVFGVSSDASNDYVIYYYRGVLENTIATYGSNGSAVTYPNYVILDADGVKTTSDTCWRIVRTTGSGGIKMIYNGNWTGSTCANAGNSVQLSTSTFNGTSSTSNQIVRVGYTYNSSYATNTASTNTISNVLGSNSNPANNNTRSDLKIYIEDTWFANNMTEWIDLFEPNAGYCNDRTVYDNTSPFTQQSESTNIVTYGTDSLAQLNFGSSIRNFKTLSGNNNRTLSLHCARGAVDLYRYVKNSTGVANELKYPVALLTADEVAFSGSGSYNSAQGSSFNGNSFLRSGTSSWLLSPYYRDTNGNSYEYVLPSGGNLNGYNVGNTYGVRPSVSLIPGIVPMSGSGTATDPWAVDDKVPGRVSFKIGGIKYYAEESMTWGEWVSSDYNTGDFSIINSLIWSPSYYGHVADYSSDSCGHVVIVSETIVDDFYYEIREPGPC